MITDRLSTYFAKIWPFLCKLGCSRRTWDPTLRLFVRPPKDSKLELIYRRNGTILLLSLIFCHSIHVYQSVSSYIRQDFSNWVFLLARILVLSMGMLAFALTNLGRWSDDWFDTANSAFIFFQKVERNAYIRYFKQEFLIKITFKRLFFN